ncbi:hypothetical protein SAMN05444412_11869 [Rhodonellum ikkaensis]|uniref:Uncharacterized protein n=1 Tax=Rhodonellum ikkaensis TaxID=336829 RepID=A0A1H3TMM0_9BACT|nr:hypothetical protein SAMN05444412_11869 [Rhodonellum ikkaensis]
MYKELEIEKWSRKDHFRFFSQFEEPFFGVTVQLDCQGPRLQQEAWSFFFSLLSSFFSCCSQPGKAFPVSYPRASGFGV